MAEAQEPIGEELTHGSGWEYRAIADGKPRPWQATVEGAIDGLVSRREHVPWPTEWTAFGVVEARKPFQTTSDPRSGEVPSAALLGRIPVTLVLDGHALERHVVRAGEDGAVDLTAVFGEPHNGRTAYLFAATELEADRRVTVHIGADWWMQWWIDGRHVWDCFRGGNQHPLLETAHEFDIDLTAGRHVLAVRIISGAGGWALATEATRVAAPPDEPGAAFRVEARRAFTVDDPARFDSLTFVGSEDRRPELNGRTIPVPLEGMRYRTVPAVPVSLLQPGPNELTTGWDESESAAGARVEGLRYFTGSGDTTRLRAKGRLFGQTAADARICTGPILGFAGPDFFTVACRTNMPTRVALDVEGERRAVSEAGLFHRSRARGLAADSEASYRLVPAAAESDCEPATGTVTMPPADPGARGLELAVMGDSATRTDIWQEIAAQVAARRPALAVFTGDMVSGGTRDWTWDERFFGPAPELFASVPFYPIAGNHDESGELARRLFVTPDEGETPPGEELNWVQEIGPVLLIGMDGAADWSKDGPLAGWLEARLAGTAARFIFAFNHFPTWSSAGHGRLDPDGRPVEAPARAGRTTIVPLLARYGATALFAGHDHCYERSELPGGPTLVTTGGAGSYLYPKQDDPEQNPYSAVFASRFHYCLLRVEAEACTLEAIALDGEVLDRRRWRPRSDSA